MGGPPTHYTWTRNDEAITDGGPYSISIAAKAENNNSVYYNSHYHSTLTVIGNLPGRYEYSVTNRATDTIKSSTYTVVGMHSYS